MEYSIVLEPNDIVVSGTDGLFDNLFLDQIVELLYNYQVSNGSKARLIAEKAEKVARMKFYEGMVTPFSAAAAEHGLEHKGGKVDDITVVIVHVS